MSDFYVIFFPEMYRQFVNDLRFVKRSISSTFLNMLENHSNPIPISGYGEQIKLNVQVSFFTIELCPLINF